MWNVTVTFTRVLKFNLHLDVNYAERRDVFIQSFTTFLDSWTGKMTEGFPENHCPIWTVLWNTWHGIKI
jgi:hypothetical protein